VLRSLLVCIALLAIAALTFYAVRPAGTAVAPVRLAILRAGVILAGSGTIVVELASGVRALNASTIVGAWLVALLVAAGVALLRHRRDPWSGGWPRLSWADTPRLDRAIGVTTGAVLFLILVIALVSAPNTYDSLTYHLPRIEHWVDRASVAFFPTSIHRQVAHSPGHEYLLTHVRLLTGGDHLYSLLSWLSAVGCVLAVTRIAAQFGGARRAQLITALVVASTPIWVMHASGTGNDIILATWVAVAATLSLDGLRERARLGDVAVLGLATGLVAVTKNNGLLAVGPLLVLWGVGQLRLAGGPARVRRYVATVGASVAILAITAATVGPFMVRMIDGFGTPLGPPDLSDHIPMQRHDPQSVFLNGLRITMTALDTPLPPLRSASASLVNATADVLGRDPNDPKTTFKENRFPTVSWHPIEDIVSFPLQAVLGFLAVGWAVVRPRWLTRDGAPWLLRSYAGVIVFAGVLFAATVKWSFSVNRLTLFLLILAAPLIGLWLTALLGERGTRLGRAFAVTALALTLITATMAVTVGYPRGLAGRGSVFVGDTLEKHLVRRSVLEADYRWVAGRIGATDARRIGIIQWGNDYEYPWYGLLPDREFVNLISVIEGHPAPKPQTVDAWICTTEKWQCDLLIPAGWRYEYRQYAGFAVPQG
jgi:hypothetical protein